MALAIAPTVWVLPAAYRMIFQNSMRSVDGVFGKDPKLRFLVFEISVLWNMDHDDHDPIFP